MLHHALPSSRPNLPPGARSTPRNKKTFSSLSSQHRSSVRSWPRWSFTTSGASFLPTLRSVSTFIYSAAVLAVGKALYKKSIGRNRRPLSPVSRMQGEDGAVQLSVATFNVRGIMDRWKERRSLLGNCIKQIDADVICFQEVLTGEFGQDRQLLDWRYHVFPCKAALFHLLAAGGVPRWYGQRVGEWLRLAPLQRMMVALPPWVEGWRERLRLGQDLFRGLRDLTLAPFFGNSVGCRLAKAHEINHSTLVLGDWRAAQRIEFSLGGGKDPPEQGSGGRDARGGREWGSRRGKGREAWAAGAGEGDRGPSGGWGEGDGAGESLKFWVVNTHLDHEHIDNRQRQALEVCRWMDKVKHDCAAIILCGDLNGGPGESFHAALRQQGYRSAHRECHGREPQGTWPTGIQAPLMDNGDFECLDYIYVVLSADLFGLDPSPLDPTLYPSDHAALRATLSIRRIPSPIPPGVEVADAARL